MPVKTQQEFYDLFISALQDQAPDLTDTTDGSIIDTIAGVVSFACAELGNITASEFRKTFIEGANGPEVTGNTDDLQTLAVDHFGTDFSRPQATKASGIVKFSRVSAGFGSFTIPAGTIVKTSPSANGVSQRFSTDEDVVLAGTTINASATAVIAGSAGNIAIHGLTTVESSLLDSTVTCDNTAVFSGGAEVQTDSQYRETIRNLIQTIRGATLQAIESKALSVTGVVTATAIETLITVRKYTSISGSPTGPIFFIPSAVLYIADANGTASLTLQNTVAAAVSHVRAAGVPISIQAATALSQAWTGHITLDPGGPNFSSLQIDATPIINTMIQYINALPIGTGFVVADAITAILDQWGPDGTTDLTAFTTSVPSGDVSATATQKLIAGSVGLA